MTKWIGGIEYFLIRIITRICRGGVIHWYQKDKRDKTVAEAEEEVCGHGCEIPIDDELNELQRRMWSGRIGKHKKHVRGKEKSKAEEGDDDEVDQTN